MSYPIEEEIEQAEKDYYKYHQCALYNNDNESGWIIKEIENINHIKRDIGYHRIDGPARIWHRHGFQWWENGSWTREDGPAQLSAGNEQVWYYKNIEIFTVGKNGRIFHFFPGGFKHASEKFKSNALKYYSKLQDEIK